MPVLQPPFAGLVPACVVSPSCVRYRVLASCHIITCLFDHRYSLIDMRSVLLLCCCSAWLCGTCQLWYPYCEDTIPVVYQLTDQIQSAEVLPTGHAVRSPEKPDAGLILIAMKLHAVNAAAAANCIVVLAGCLLSLCWAVCGAVSQVLVMVWCIVTPQGLGGSGSRMAAIAICLC